ncbi:MAG: hypothetical protein V4604_08310 [Bacteroidota bacterium]
MNTFKSFLHDRRKSKLRNLVLIALITVGICLGCFLLFKPSKTVSVFAIPEAVTPIELEQRGFEVTRVYRISKNGTKQVSKIEQCKLTVGIGVTFIHYRDNDTTRISNQIFRLDNLTFRQMTKLKPANYNAVLIDGVSYYVKQDSKKQSLFLSRQNLTNHESNHHYYCNVSD